MAPTMKAMKAMKAGGGAMTATAAFGAVAEKAGLKSKDVKAVVTAYMEVAATEIKTNGKFKFGGCLNLRSRRSLPLLPARESILSPRSHACSKPSLLPRPSELMP